MVKISIIVPVYNVEQYIEECLQSVAAQTMTDGMECIIVDDRGQDNSISIVERFVSNYKGSIRFSIIHHEKNGGLSAARNSGVYAAMGEYLYFLDSDDYIVPECIEILYSFARENNADVVQGAYITGSRHLDKAMSIAHPTFTDDRRYIKRTFLDYDRNPVMAQNRLVRRCLIVENNIWFKEGIIHEDNYWTFFLAKYVKRMAFCPEKLYFYRETPGSITRNKDAEKEAHAFTTMVRDFTENIDEFELGAQKRYIFLHILFMEEYKSRIPERVYKELLKNFALLCSPLESFFIRIAISSNGFVRQKSINFLQRLFAKE